MHMPVAKKMVEGGGFEPPKALPTDLQSVPFDHSGTPPNLKNKEQPLHYRTAQTRNASSSSFNRWSWRWDLNPQPPDYKSGALPIELRQHDNLWDASYSKSKPLASFFFSLIKKPDWCSLVFSKSYPTTGIY